MEETGISSGYKGQLDRALSRFVGINLKFWWVFLLSALVLAVVGAVLSFRIRLDSDLQSLLPRSAPSVQNMNVIKDKAGGSYDFRVVLFGGSLEKRLEAADRFTKFLETDKKGFARSVRYRTPKTFLEENKYKFIPVESLDSILARIERERKANAAVTDPLGLESTMEKMDGEASQDVADAQSANEAVALSEKDEDKDLDSAKELLQRLEDMRPYYQTEDGAYLAIRILPAQESFSIERNRIAMRTLDAYLKEFDFAQVDPAIRYEIYGTIPSHIHRFDSIAQDVKFGVWGVILILLIVALYFRSGWSLLTTVPPLLVGLSIGMGIVGMIERDLNSIAIFLVLVVFGVGIEFGIHLWARYLEERQSRDFRSALDRTWRTTGRATLTSSSALLCGFALLTLSSFQGFAQFGRVAIILVLTAAGSFVIFMPSWILLAEKLRGSSKPWALSIAQIFSGRARALWWPQSWLPFVRWGSLSLVITGVVLSALYFRFDFGFAEAINTRKTTPAREALTEIFTERLQPSAIAVFKSQSEAARFLDFYRTHENDYPDIALASGLSTFLPVDQEERIKKLQEISDEVEEEWIGRFKDEVIREALKEIKSSAYDMTPHRLEDVPAETREPFIASDQSGDFMVYLFDVGGAPDGRKAMKFKKAVEELERSSGQTPVLSGQQVIFADIVSRVIGEGPWLVLGMLLLVFLICWIDFQSWSLAAVTMIPVLSGFALTGMVLVFEGTNINFFNMVALASLGAMVVDNSIHLFHRFLELREEGRPAADREAAVSVGPTVATCTLTSICGYGGMALALHNGIASLGWVAIVGLSCCFVSSVTFFPAWLGIFFEREVNAQENRKEGLGS